MSDSAAVLYGGTPAPAAEVTPAQEPSAIAAALYPQAEAPANWLDSAVVEKRTQGVERCDTYPASEPEAKPEPKAKEQSEPAAKSEPEVTPWTRSEAELVKSFYDPRVTYEKATSAVEEAAALHVSPELAKADGALWWPVLARFEVNRDDAAGIADALGTIYRSGAATVEQREAWLAASKSHLDSTYGDSAGQVQKDMRALVASDPRAKQFFDMTGLGSHPAFIRALARSAQQFRAAGKLK